jgi:hypothetical protein
MSGNRENIFPTRMALTNTKTRLKGAQTGHSLLAKKRDALTTRFRAILRKVDEVCFSMAPIPMYTQRCVRPSARWARSCRSRPSPSPKSHMPRATLPTSYKSKRNRQPFVSKQGKTMCLVSFYLRSRWIGFKAMVRVLAACIKTIYTHADPMLLNRFQLDRFGAWWPEGHQSSGSLRESR